MTNSIATFANASVAKSEGAGPRAARTPWRWSRLARSQARHGKVLVLFVVSLSSILAVVGLVLDTGLMLAGEENLRHATDAAAMAAAEDLRLGKSTAQATATATTYIQGLNGLADATVTVNIPPTQGAYAAQANYVEVIASRVYQLQLMQIVTAGPQQSYRVRAVAGYTPSTAGAAIVALDPNPPAFSISAVPPTLPLYSGLLGGLEILGGGTVGVNGAVLVNTTWGGVDENGNPAGTELRSALWDFLHAADSFDPSQCENIHAVGGVRLRVQLRQLRLWPAD